MDRPLITAQDVERAARAGGVLYVDGPYVVAPSAEDRLLKLNVRIEPTPRPASGRRKVALAADHGGFELKEELKEHLESLGYGIFDFGTNSKESVDYPDFALKAAVAVAEGTCERAIVVDGAGIGSCMVANKVPGVRAAKCDSMFDILNSRGHNNANVLTLGTRHPAAEVREWAKAWLEAPFEGGRHERRMGKIEEIERRYLRSPFLGGTMTS